MNNSFLATHYVDLTDEQPLYDIESIRERESKIVRTIEAIRAIRGKKEWSTLKKEVFDDLTGFLETELRAEARKATPDVLRLNRLSGQLMWAERFSNLEGLENEFHNELNSIRTTYGTTKERPAG